VRYIGLTSSLTAKCLYEDFTAGQRRVSWRPFQAVAFCKHIAIDYELRCNKRILSIYFASAQQVGLVWFGFILTLKRA
jgi:hypothetical protein